MSKKNIAYVNNNMLIWARNTTPFETTIDVQEKVNINASKIDSWENGTDYPSVTEAKRLAKLYKLPFAAFFLTTPTEREPRPYTDRRTARGRFIMKQAMNFGQKLGE